MRVLLMGGAGFIGSHIADELLREGHEVIIYDNFSTGSMANTANLKDRIKIVEGDVLDFDRILSAAKGCDLISHQAAQLEIGSAINTPLMDARVNIEGTPNVLETAVRNKVKKVIYASSASVYGEAVKLPQDEEHPKNPSWPYGVSRYSGGFYCLQYSLFYGIKTYGLRYGIVYVRGSGLGGS
ncbi:MAG: NAD-dependent epimerase/dehydratase family protein [Candidatus Methanomethylicaceae archaeon]